VDPQEDDLGEGVPGSARQANDARRGRLTQPALLGVVGRAREGGHHLLEITVLALELGLAG
jgi:hypothetical protein